MTLGELCELVDGRVPILLELKSRFDGDGRLPLRVASVLAGCKGPAAPMSFDPMQLSWLRQKAPRLPRGIIAAKYRPHPYWDQMPAWLRYGMGSLLPAALTARPHFVAYACNRPAGPGAMAGAARSCACRYGLDGAQRGRASTRDGLRRPDHFRRFSAMTPPAKDELRLNINAARPTNATSNRRAARSGGRRPAHRRGQHNQRGQAADWNAAPIRRREKRHACARPQLQNLIRRQHITLSYRTLFVRPWRPPNRSAASPRWRVQHLLCTAPTARSWPPRPAT